ncbi:MAG: ABC transporter substrate-binding protein [Rhodospirillaceae bacterium]|jgi:NitT/TauT family transport system substrate-binding protein|nr:ABC transporter substrate-binding protein [Rhodospirillaceae bacterium]MBT5567101.1 ABC transporter substrate-binding protein [Rhodospirillaceae bacterium]MBT6089315.1 ABC transporter substrate-binding protein [Rhodospirillaceae bacterium]
MHRRRERTLPFVVVFFLAALSLFASSDSSFATDQITFGTDWRAQAEHGGFYQALALGFYDDAGIDVTIRQGGPQVNHSQLLAAGRLDFGMSPNSFLPINFAFQEIPVVAVAAMFQKDPAVLIAHASRGHQTLSNLKTEKIMISPETRIGFWRFLKVRYGFTDNQIAPYTFNVAPFLADATSVQQGYLTSEPFVIDEAGIEPSVFLLADSGYASYAAVIQTSQRMIDSNPDLVQRFVDASIRGWYSFLYTDPAPAYALIKRDNADMTDELLNYGHEMLRRYGLVDSGDAALNGIGIMTEARWRAFFDVMAEDNVYPADLDFTKAYTLRFIGKRVGMDAVLRGAD